jgi:hypothetical protein
MYLIEAVATAGVGNTYLFVFGFSSERRGATFADERREVCMPVFGAFGWVSSSDRSGISPRGVPAIWTSQREAFAFLSGVGESREMDDRRVKGFGGSRAFRWSEFG